MATNIKNTNVIKYQKVLSLDDRILTNELISKNKDCEVKALIKKAQTYLHPPISSVRFLEVRY